MNVLVIGQGGREHALVKSFAQSKVVQTVYALPGNPGMTEATLVLLKPNQTHEIIEFCKNKSVDFVFIGPEGPLCEGLSDHLRQANIPVVGPSQEAAQLEGSKIFAKEFMISAGIPTARSFVVTSTTEAINAAASFQPPFVLKADGLASGKGVFICDDLDSLKQAAQEIFEKGSLGQAGKKALLEEFTDGYEISYLILTNGSDYVSLPLAQDHKRLKENQTGPNTGGMGTVAPFPIGPSLKKQIEDEIIQKSLAEIQKRKMLFRGVLFIGLMVKENKASVLEFNVRFGDPETQVILPLIENDFLLFCKNLAQGKLEPLKFSQNKSAVCVVLAAESYPDQPVLGAKITGDLLFADEHSYFIHAGTQRENQQWMVGGGRVLGAVGIGQTVQQAQQKAYELVEKVSWKGLQYRKDIGDQVQVMATSSS